MIEILIDSQKDSQMVLAFIRSLFDHAEVWRELEREFEGLQEIDIEAINPQL
jgi:hypothetical protein